MAKKKKVMTVRTSTVGQSKKYQKPTWMKVTRLITLIILSVLGVLACIALAIHYYQLVTSN